MCWSKIPLPALFYDENVTNLGEELTASLNSLGPLAWVKLSDDQVCFTIIPEQGTQVWA
jgi:hypothetical protein